MSENGKTVFEKLDVMVHRARAEWALGRLAPYLKPGEQVLNLGAGDGFLSRMIRERFNCNVTNVDVVDSALLPEEPVVVYDGEHLPFPDDSFDCVLLLHVLHHCLNQRQVARETARVCRGRAVVIEDTNRGKADLALLRWVHAYLEKMEDMPAAECHFRCPADWVGFFESCGLKLVSRTSWPLYMNFLPPGNQLYVLRPVKQVAPRIEPEMAAV